MEVVGYTYDADVHCPKCTFDMAREIPYADYVFGEYDDSDISTFPGSGITDMEKAIELEIIRDSEGNPIRPVFDTDESGDSPDHCGDCHAFIDTSWSGSTVSYVCEAFATYIDVFMKGSGTAAYGGNVETLDEWRENLKNCIIDSNDERIVMLYDVVREYEDADD